MKYENKLFENRSELLTYTSMATNKEIDEHLKKCDTLDSFMEPYAYWFGRVNHRFLHRLKQLEVAFLSTRKMLHISYFVFFFFFYLVLENKDYLHTAVYDLGLFVFFPFVLLAYYPTRKRIEFDFAQINSALLKEQALCAALIYDNIYGKTEIRDILIRMSPQEQDNKLLLDEIKQTTIHYFHNETYYPKWMKSFITRNYDIYTNNVFYQPNSNNFFNENYRAIFSHVAILQEDFVDSKETKPK